MTLRETFALPAFLAIVAFAGLYLAMLVRMRRPGLSSGEFYAGPPLWLVRPKYYFTWGGWMSPRLGFLAWAVFTCLASWLVKRFSALEGRGGEIAGSAGRLRL